MQNTLRSLIFTALVAATFAHADATPPNPPATPPASKCEELVKQFSDLYDTLYNVDTRPLTIESYRSYRDGIQLLHQYTLSLTELCSASNSVTSPQTL